MISRYIEEAIDQIPGLEEVGNSLSRAIHRAILAGGDPSREITDFLHGTWLGHPLHSVLTDAVVGSWMLAALFDGIAIGSGSERAEWAADTLVATGIVSAIPTALTGLTDYSAIPHPATRTATVHGTINALALTFYVASLWQRKQGNRSRGFVLSSLAFALVTAGAWLGGHLTYGQKVGVDHAEEPSKPREWTAVLAEAELPEGEATRVEVEGLPVLLYRYDGTVYASSATCPHAGGPLEKGSFEGYCVQCPWHDSVFDLRDGSIVHGPTVHTVPLYKARIQQGQIEIRRGD